MEKNVLNKISTVGVVATVGVLVSLSGTLDTSFSSVDTAYGYGSSHSNSISKDTNAFDVENDSNVNGGESSTESNTEDKTSENETSDSDKTTTTEEKTTENTKEEKETTNVKDSETVKNDRIVKVNGEKVYTLNKNVSDVSKKIVDADMTDFNSKFEDISDSKYKSDIERLEKSDVVNGTTETTFEPSKKISRAEFLAIVLTANGYDVSKTPKSLPFNDVDLSSWQARVISAALENNFISGDKDASGNRVFRADDAISKIEAMAITLSVRDFEVPSDFKHSFTDSAAAWQNKILNEVEYLNLNTDDSNEFKPNSTIDRDTMAHFIVSVLRLY